MFDVERDQQLEVDEGSQLDRAVPGDEGAEDHVEHEGAQYPRAQLRDAFEALKNRESWERDFKNRDKAFAKVRQVIELAFDKPYTSLTRDDLRDLQGFAVLNSKVRDDPKFASAFETTLARLYRGEGLSEGEAKAEAKADVKEIKAGEKSAVDLPEDVKVRLAKVDQIEARQTSRDQAELKTHVNGSVDGEISRQIGEYGDYTEFVKQQVLYGILGFSDVELRQMAQEGELEPFLAEVTKKVMGRLTGSLEAGQKARAKALQANGRAAPAPLKGQGAPVGRRDEIQFKRGRGLSGLHDRARTNIATLGSDDN